MFEKLFIFLFVFFSGCFLYAQDNKLSLSEENGSKLNVLYRHNVSGKVYVTPRGSGLMFRQGRHVTDKTRSFYEIDIQNLKHPKEIKSQGISEEKKRFVYGKINSVFLLRGGVGLQHVIFNKGDIKAVEVRYSYSLGPTIAFAKPYYIRVYKSNTPGLRNQTTLVKFDTESFSGDSNVVVGRAAYSTGVNEMKFYPGVNAKFNLSFEYAPYTNLIRAIETGLSLDYFPKALPIMARNPAENFVLTFHLGFVFGTKWY